MKKIEIIPMKKDALISINIESAISQVPKWYKESPQKIKGLEKNKRTQPPDVR